jgi:electron transfer flavoprotein beta subunit
MPLNVIVIAREVWDTRDLVAAPLDEAGGLKSGSLATRYEPEDLNALEMALRLKDQQGAKVIVLSHGPAGNVDAPREALYRGADEAHRIDVARDAVDTQAAAKLYAAALKKLGAFDLVLLGVNVTEGENSLLAGQLAALLDLEQISYADGIEVASGAVTGKRAVEMGYEYVEAAMPAVVSVGVALVADDPRTPRSAKAMLKLKHKKTEIKTITPADLGIADVAALRTTKVAGYRAIEARKVDAKDVDPESESALKSMLDAVLKGGG